MNGYLKLLPKKEHFAKVCKSKSLSTTSLYTYPPSYPLKTSSEVISAVSLGLGHAVTSVLVNGNVLNSSVDSCSSYMYIYHHHHSFYVRFSMPAWFLDGTSLKQTFLRPDALPVANPYLLPSKVFPMVT